MKYPGKIARAVEPGGSGDFRNVHIRTFEQIGRFGQTDRADEEGRRFARVIPIGTPVFTGISLAPCPYQTGMVICVQHRTHPTPIGHQRNAQSLRRAHLILLQ